WPVRFIFNKLLVPECRCGPVKRDSNVVGLHITEGLNKDIGEAERSIDWLSTLGCKVFGYSMKGPVDHGMSINLKDRLAPGRSRSSNLCLLGMLCHHNDSFLLLRQYPVVPIFIPLPHTEAGARWPGSSSVDHNKNQLRDFPQWNVAPIRLAQPYSHFSSNLTWSRQSDTPGPARRVEIDLLFPCLALERIDAHHMCVTGNGVAQQWVTPEHVMHTSCYTFSHLIYHWRT